MDNNERDVRDMLEVLGVDYNANSEKVLEDIVGDKINYEVLKYLILKNKKGFIYAVEKEMPQNYRFVILKRIVENKYININNALNLLENSEKYVEYYEQNVLKIG